MCNAHPHDETCVAPALDVPGIVDEIVVAVSNTRIYRPDHPRVAASVRALVEGLEAWLVQHETDRLEIGTADGFLFHDRRPLLGASLSAPRIVEPLKRLRAGSLIYDAVRRGVAIYSPHTALDVADGGTNDLLADALGIVNREALKLAEVKATQCKLVVFAPHEHVADLPQPRVLALKVVDFVGC